MPGPCWVAFHHDKGGAGGLDRQKRKDCKRAKEPLLRGKLDGLFLGYELKWGGEPEPINRQCLRRSARFAGKTGPEFPGRFFFCHRHPRPSSRNQRPQRHTGESWYPVPRGCAGKEWQL